MISMEKNSYSQLELFKNAETDTGSGPQRHSKSFLNFIWSYEKTILIIIGMIITGIISFSFGVKRGKELAQNKPQAIMKSVSTQLLPLEPIKPSQPPTPVEKTVGYTIQIASFKSRASAEKELSSLKKKGFSALILPKGEFAVVCVGNFSDKNAAKPLLSELKKRYDDCYIRRL